MQTTTHGPVGIFGARYEHNVPRVPPINPKMIASTIIGASRLVQRRAEAAGAINSAAMSIAPAVCIPRATDTAARVEISARNTTGRTP